MIDLEGVVLGKLLRGSSDSLEHFARLKSAFFTEMYKPIFRAVHDLYSRTGTVPSFDELEVVVKDAKLQNNLAALKSLDLPDVEIDLVIDGLTDRYAQTEALGSVDRLLDRITMLNASEIKEGIAAISLELDSKLHTADNIIMADQIYLFKSSEDAQLERVPSGISNDYDSKVGGLFKGELILLGGKRGSGKSIVCHNLTVAQYENNKVSIFYTIEMSAAEILGRFICTLGRVSYENYRLGQLDPMERVALAKARAGMFQDADDLLTEFSNSTEKDLTGFEQTLVKKTLREDRQIIIVDDRDLSLATIDLTLQKFKAQFGDKLSFVAIDYLNQLVVEGTSDIYDWKEQIAISKHLKNLARKHDLPIVTPYQIDDAGQARFSKGILDACDVAIILIAEENTITFKAAKARNADDKFEFRQPMDWVSLRLDPVTIEDVSEEVGESDPEAVGSMRATLMDKARVRSEDDIQ